MRSSIVSRHRKSFYLAMAMLKDLRADPANEKISLELQEYLIKKISYIELRMRQLRRAVEESKKELRTRRTDQHAKRRSTELKIAIRHLNEQIDGYSFLAFLYRHIGDGIAFTYLNKWDIKPLAMKEEAGFISRKKGNRLERRMLRSIHEKLGRIAILNDLTTCLRYGDLTIPKDGRFMIIEAKSKKRKSHKQSRQLAQMEKVTKYVATDLGEDMFEQKGPVRRVGYSGRERSHVKRLNRMIRDAMKRGHAFEKVEDGVFYLIVKGEPRLVLDRFMKRIPAGSLASYVNAASSHGYYPIVLSFSEPDFVWSFFCDELSILIFVDPSKVEEILKAKNLTVEFLFDDTWLFSCASTKPGDDFFMKMGTFLFSRVFLEFVSLRWLLESTSTSAQTYTLDEYGSASGSTVSLTHEE